MLFKKKEKESKPKKEKRVPVMKIGTHKKTVLALWLVLLASVSFGVYKNFTAIDRHTVHEKEVIEQRIIILGATRRNPLTQGLRISTAI